MESRSPRVSLDVHGAVERLIQWVPEEAGDLLLQPAERLLQSPTVERQLAEGPAAVVEEEESGRRGAERRAERLRPRDRSLGESPGFLGPAEALLAIIGLVLEEAFADGGWIAKDVNRVRPWSGGGPALVKFPQVSERRMRCRR